MSRRLLLCGALGALGALAQGCVDNEISFFIQQEQVPQLSGAMVAGCIVSPDPTSLHRNEGVLDLSIASSYRMHPLYRSEILSSAVRGTGRAEMRGMFVDGADIDLRVGSETGALFTVNGAPAIPNQYRISTTAFIDAASSEGPSYATGTLEIIPPQVGAAIAAHFCQPGPATDSCPVPAWPNSSTQVIVVIRPFGHTMGGLQISGSHFIFPLTLCCHCLVQFQSAADNPATSFPDCSSTTGIALAACDPGQDDPVDCRTCALSNPAACQPPGFVASGTAACPIQ